MTRTLAALGTFLLAATPLFATDAVAPGRAMSPAPFYLPPPIVFADLPEFFAFVAHSRGLGDAGDPAVPRQMSAASSVQRFHDRSRDRILVIKADLHSPDGSSRLRSPTGNYPLYVLRSTSRGLILLGTMFGTGYTAHFDGRELQFQVKLNTAAGKSRALSFRVDRNSLTNLSAHPCASPDCGIASSAGLRSAPPYSR